MDNRNFNQMNQQMSQMGMYNGYTDPTLESRCTKTLIWSIVQMFCCSQLTGIIALIFSIIAKSLCQTNPYEAEGKLKTANTALKIGWILAIIGAVLGIIYAVFIIVWGGFNAALN